MSGALLAGLALAGCGGSGHAVTTQSRAATAPPPTTAPSATTAPPPTTTTATATTPPSGPTTPSSAPSDHGPRIPATFTITAGDHGTPPAISAPGRIALALTLVSGDGQAHSALVGTTPSHALHVPAHGRASLLLRGLRDGRYPTVLDHGDGTLSLVIGVQPGP